MPFRHRPLSALVALAASVFALTGCVTQTASEEAAGQQIAISAAWLDDGRLIGLVTSGSSACVPTVDDVDVNDQGGLSISLTLDEDGSACTDDYEERVTLVTVPDGVDPADDLMIWATGGGYYGDVMLDGVSDLAGPGGSTDYEPSAGWIGTTGQFIVLTWGSSGCPPVVEDASVTGIAEVTVVFEDPAADQICTADMAPRTTIAMAQGIHDDPDVQLVLTGDSFDTTIPLYGINP